MTIHEWNKRGDLKEQLGKLLQSEVLKSAIEVMKDMNRPAMVDSLDPVAHTIVHATCLGYDKALRDLEKNLVLTELSRAKFTEKPFEYIKEKIERLNPPPLIPARKN